jgi:hypothetical protein
LGKWTLSFRGAIVTISSVVRTVQTTGNG